MDKPAPDSAANGLMMGERGGLGQLQSKECGGTVEGRLEKAERIPP